MDSSVKVKSGYGILASLAALAAGLLLACAVAPPSAHAATAAGSWGEWGAWSGWQAEAVAGSDSRQVETRTVTVSYDMESYVCGNSDRARCYLSSMQGGYTLRAHWNETWGADVVENPANRVAQGSWYSYADNVNGWIVGPGDAYVGWNHVPFFIARENKQVQYRYRERAWVPAPEDPKAEFAAARLTPPRKQAHTGKALKPAIKLVSGGTTLKAGEHYRLAYKNNKNVGTASVTVIGLGKYKGAKRTCTFEIVPRKTKVKAAKAKLTGTGASVSWGALAGKCSGFQVRYAKSRAMAGAKAKTVAGAAKRGCSLSGLASGTVYYVEVRVYLVVGGTRYWSAWSAPVRVETPACGSVGGVVCSAKTGKALSGARATVCTRSGKRVCSAKATSAGRYRIPSLAAGTYRLRLSRGGYIVCSVRIVVIAGKTTNCESALLVRSYSGKGKATGRVCSATTGYGVAGARLSFKRGWNNAAGATVATCRAGADGGYSVSLRAGYYTAVITCGGYVKATMNIYVGAGTCANQNGVVSPKANRSTTYRAVLTWGKNPRDIDSHLASEGAGGGYHVYWNAKDAYLGSKRVAMLDVDDTTSYGPETVTFTVDEARTYAYYVYLFAGSGRLQTSSAQVRLYKGNELIRSYAVPSGGKGRFWNVFAINDGKVVDRQTVTASPVGVSAAHAKEGKNSSGYRAASASGL